MKTPAQELATLERKHKLLTLELEALRSETTEADSDQSLGITLSARQRYNLLRIEVLEEELGPLEEALKSKRDYIEWLNRMNESERAPR